MANHKLHLMNYTKKTSIHEMHSQKQMQSGHKGQAISACQFTECYDSSDKLALSQGSTSI